MTTNIRIRKKLLEKYNCSDIQLNDILNAKYGITSFDRETILSVCKNEFLSSFLLY